MSTMTSAVTASTVNSPAEGGRFFRDNGFVVGPSLAPADLLARAARGMDEVMAGRYETGQRPLDGWWKPTDDPTKKLRKIDQPHVANRAIFELITYPAVGKWIAEAVGASSLQVWCVQLLYKPGTGPEASSQGNVGWHQDYFYWKNWYTPDSEVFTCWLAVSDVAEEAGAMHFARGSHRWGLLPESEFFGTGDKSQASKIGLPPGAVWDEASGAMPAGAFSLHHKLTFHGSGPNRTRAARRSFAIHLRTENSTPTPCGPMNPSDPDPYDYVSFLGDKRICPVIFEK